MSDFKIGGSYLTRARGERSEPFRFGDAAGAVSPLFDEIVHTVNPETGHAVTFLPGEAKPQYVIEQELAEQSKPDPETTPAPKAGRRAIKAEPKDPA